MPAYKDTRTPAERRSAALKKLVPLRRYGIVYRHDSEGDFRLATDYTGPRLFDSCAAARRYAADWELTERVDTEVVTIILEILPP